MGHRPVSEELQTRAGEFGFDFEHLGTTIGSVIHGIALEQLDSSELIRFVRDVLLERKVVFFRDQHLGEDEQVAFGKKFGELDAFPFGPAGQNPYILEIRHGRIQPGAREWLAHRCHMDGGRIVISSSVFSTSDKYAYDNQVPIEV